MVLKSLDEPRDIMSSLIKELNEKFNTGLDNNFSTSREANVSLDLGEIQPPLENFIVIGSSHVARRAVSMKNMEENMNCMASPYWRLTEENVLTRAKMLEEAVKHNPSATIIFQLYNSSVYFASSAPGEQALLRRGSDGKYHVSGELILADWTMEE